MEVLHFVDLHSYLMEVLHFVELHSYLMEVFYHYLFFGDSVVWRKQERPSQTHMGGVSSEDVLLVL